MQDDAEVIDEALLKITSHRHRHLYYKKTIPEERLVAMCHDDVKNIKSRCETLCNVNLKEKAWNTAISRHVTLESVMMKAKIDNNPLFLAAEQGAGKFSNSVNVVINPKTKAQSKRWLSHDCPSLTLYSKKG